MDTIRQRPVLQAVLMQTLAEHPDGLPTESVYDMIDQGYVFPEEWYRQIPDARGYAEIERRGYANWREVPQELLIEIVATEPQWKNEIRWARNNLRKSGHLDTSAPRGIWKLTPSGMAAAGTHATERLSPDEQRVLSSRRPRAATAEPAAPPSEPGRGLRSELSSQLNSVIRSMPLSDLQMLVDLARVIRKRSLPQDE